MRVLIIDDNAAYLSACTAVLTADGHDVVGCVSFDEKGVAGWHATRSMSSSRTCASAHITGCICSRSPHLPLSDSRCRRSPNPVLRHHAEQGGARFVVKPADCTSLSTLLLPHRG